MEKEEFYCDCEERCKGKRQKLSRATYFHHQKHWDPLSKYSPRMQNYLNKKLIIHVLLLHATWTLLRHKARQSDVDTDDMIGRQNKRVRKLGEGTNHDVGTSFGRY